MTWEVVCTVPHAQPLSSAYKHFACTAIIQRSFQSLRHQDGVHSTGSTGLLFL